MAESALSGGDGFTGAVELVSGATKALSQVICKKNKKKVEQFFLNTL